MNFLRVLITFCLCLTVVLNFKTQTMSVSEESEYAESAQFETQPVLFPLIPVQELFSQLKVLGLPLAAELARANYSTPVIQGPQEVNSILHTNLPPPTLL